MIKLEDLKNGDKVYGILSDGNIGLYAESVVYLELFILDNDPKNPYEAVACTGGIEILTRHHEKYIYRSEEEAINEVKRLKTIAAKELIDNGRFYERILECATSNKRLNKYREEDIFRIALDIVKNKISKDIYEE